MSQSLTFLETTLSHDHPVFTGILRIALERTKAKADQNILRLYSIGLVFLPLTAITGVFSLNADVPHDGDRYTHEDDEGNPAGYHWFGVAFGFVSSTGSLPTQPKRSIHSFTDYHLCQFGGTGHLPHFQQLPSTFRCPPWAFRLWLTLLALVV